MIGDNAVGTLIHDSSPIQVAGDVSDKLEQFETTLESLRSKFREVFFCPGGYTPRAVPAAIKTAAVRGFVSTPCPQSTAMRS